MKRVVVVGSLLALVLVLPAAARQQETETVTLKVGQTVPLETVFDKKRTYSIVMSGLVTMTLKVGNLTQVYDPFYGAADANCTNSGASVYLQIKDASGNLIDFGTANKPPCRKDHRYEFVVNDNYPPAWDLHGKANAYITLQPNPRDWTASGSFRLVIKEEPPEPVATVTFQARPAKQGLLSGTYLRGRGQMVTTEIKEGRLADTARLVQGATLSGKRPEFKYVEERQDRYVTVQVTSGELVMRGAAGSKAERLAVRLIVEVVASNKPCAARFLKTPQGERGTMTLVYYPRGAPDEDRVVNTTLKLPRCIEEEWTDAESDSTIRVEKLKKKG